MADRAEIVAPERNVSVEILGGRDGREFSHRLRMDPTSAVRSEGSGRFVRLALIRVRSASRVATEGVARRSCALR